ncbi:signal recognition particle-docking protein FtsY [bacterium]|nr:signal recognition particle-docking protein FtsY [bacterium]
MFNFFKKNNEENTQKTNIFQNTGNAILSGFANLLNQDKPFDEFELEDIESNLIRADIGVELAVDIVEKIRKNKITSSKLVDFLKSEFENTLKDSTETNLKYDENKLNVYFVVGINGAGKTTLIGKLANKLKNEGKKVLIVAGDTFRAAAEEQLDIWAQRAGVDIVRKDRIDSSAVIYEGLEKAQKEGYNVLLIDTAGRLQNKFNLIEELKKNKSVITKLAPDCINENILVLDANLGQNGLSQAKVFTEAVDVTCCAVTKLDGSARGGIIFAIAHDFHIPTKLIGVGEKIDDIKDFNSKEFIEKIFA